MRRDKSVASLLLCEARFVASIEMVEGVPKVTWLPDLGVERVYWVLGARRALWREGTSGTVDL